MIMLIFSKQWERTRERLTGREILSPWSLSAAGHLESNRLPVALTGRRDGGRVIRMLPNPIRGGEGPLTEEKQNKGPSLERSHAKTTRSLELDHGTMRSKGYAGSAES